METRKEHSIWRCFKSIKNIPDMVRVLYQIFTGGYKLPPDTKPNKAHVAELLNFVDQKEKFTADDVEHILKELRGARNFSLSIRKLIYSSELSRTKKEIIEQIETSLRASLDKEDLFRNILSEYIRMPTKLHKILFMNLLYDYVNSNVPSLITLKRTVKDGIKGLTTSIAENEECGQENLHDVFGKLSELFIDAQDEAHAIAYPKPKNNRRNKRAETIKLKERLTKLGIKDPKLLKHATSIYFLLNTEKRNELMQIIQDIDDDSKKMDSIIKKYKTKRLVNTKKCFRIRLFGQNNEYRIIFALKDGANTSSRKIIFIGTREEAKAFYKAGLKR